jgi:hypothetical protein
VRALHEQGHVNMGVQKQVMEHEGGFEAEPEGVKVQGGNDDVWASSTTIHEI